MQTAFQAYFPVKAAEPGAQWLLRFPCPSQESFTPSPAREQMGKLIDALREASKPVLLRFWYEFQENAGSETDLLGLEA